MSRENEVFDANLPPMIEKGASLAHIPLYSIPVESFNYLEYPQSGSPLSETLCKPCLEPGPDGLVRLADAPGLGVTIDMDAVKRYHRPVKITVDGVRLLEA